MAGIRDFFHLRNIHTGFGVPSSYSVGTRCCFPKDKVSSAHSWLFTPI